MLSETCILLCAILLADRASTVRSNSHPDDGPCFYEQRDDGKLIKLESVRVSEKGCTL